MKITEKLKNKQINPHLNKSVTMCFLGDSVTHGCFEMRKLVDGNFDTVYDYEEAYCKKLEKLIKTAYPSAQFNVINSGISGDTAKGGLKRLERDVLSFEPDFVCVCFGLNDCGLRDEGYEEYISSLDAIFKKINELKNVDVVFMTPNMMNTYVSPEIKEEFLIACAKNSMDIQNGGVLDKYINGAIEVAKQNSVMVVDCYAEWKKMFNAGVDITNLLSNRLNHPTREMHWLFAHSLMKKIFE